ncbi:hypothetical protein CLU79DRAFT_711488 [Phycomyces nitens]|nr:hypothetical protein CLU79DRAFT_711488 [Phycomyces nitens]
MPIIEIITSRLPKDLVSFNKKVVAIISEISEKPENAITVNIVDSIYFGYTTEDSFLVKVNRIGGRSKYNYCIQTPNVLIIHHIDQQVNTATTIRISAAIKEYMDMDNTRGMFLFTDYPFNNVGFMNKTIQSNGCQK